LACQISPASLACYIGHCGGIYGRFSRGSNSHHATQSETGGSGADCHRFSTSLACGIEPIAARFATTASSIGVRTGTRACGAPDEPVGARCRKLIRVWGASSALHALLAGIAARGSRNAVVAVANAVTFGEPCS